MIRTFSWNPNAAQMLVLVLLLCLSLQSARALKLHRNRAEVLAKMSEKEGRLYFDGCTMSGSGSSCGLAMDDSQSQEPSQCAVSEVIPNGLFWEGTLETPAYITKITILNIDEMYMSFKDGLYNMTIKVNGDPCYLYESLEVFTKRSFPCDTVGDRIRIESLMTDAVLSICDIEVMGVPLKFPTVLSKPRMLTLQHCYQSSIEGKQYCHYAIDNSTSSCGATHTEASPWIEVVLTKPAYVHEIKLSGSDLTNLRLTLDEQHCDDSSGSGALTFHCSKLGSSRFGNTIRITKTGGASSSLSLCHVEVQGHGSDLFFDERSFFKHMGCYADDVYQPKMPDLASFTHMSEEKCYGLCKRKNMGFFALGAGGRCFCGNSLSHSAKESEDKCSTPCGAKDWQKCGGSEKGNKVYSSVFQITG